MDDESAMVAPKRRILLLSFYYPPDLSAGSFRCASLVRALREVAPDVAVELITTRPNRYRSFSSDAPEVERDAEVTITRVPLPPHAGGMRDQARAFLAFAAAVWRLTAGRRYDAVFGTSSRLMTAALAAATARRLGAPLHLDIRDIFVDTIGDVLPRPMSLPLRWLFSPLERWTIGAAQRVNLVSEGFRPYFERRFPRQSFTYFTNGIDDLFELSGGAPQERMGNRTIRLLYAGNIGEGQGLHTIVPGLARALRGRATIRIIGDGGRRAQLEAAIRLAQVGDLVTLVPPVERTALLDEYRAADVLFLHLNDYPAFEKVLPSKIFEYAALGKPILAGVGGHAAIFVRNEVPNAAVFAPCDVAAGVTALGTLELADRPRTAFVESFRRSHIMRQLAADLVAIAAQGSPGPNR